MWRSVTSVLTHSGVRGLSPVIACLPPFAGGKKRVLVYFPISLGRYVAVFRGGWCLVLLRYPCLLSIGGRTVAGPDLLGGRLVLACCVKGFWLSLDGGCFWAPAVRSGGGDAGAVAGGLLAGAVTLGLRRSWVCGSWGGEFRWAHVWGSDSVSACANRFSGRGEGGRV